MIMKLSKLPLLTLLLSMNSKVLFGDYVFDNELIIVNGLITFILLLCVSKKQEPVISTDL